MPRVARPDFVLIEILLDGAHSARSIIIVHVARVACVTEPLHIALSCSVGRFAEKSKEKDARAQDCSLFVLSDLKALFLLRQCFMNAYPCEVDHGCTEKHPRR